MLSCFSLANSANVDTHLLIFLRCVLQQVSGGVIPNLWCKYVFDRLIWKCFSMHCLIVCKIHRSLSSVI